MNYFCDSMSQVGLETSACSQFMLAHNFMNSRFQAHMNEQGLSYATSEEYNLRMSIWAEKDAFINEHNSQNGSYTVGHNKFSTWTAEEFTAIMGGRADGIQKNIVELPATNDAEVDWRSKGAVNPVKDQARCGSCWAFSAIAAFEGSHAINTGELVSMSEQQVVSCDTVSYGCNGGWQYAAFEYFEATADELEADYPYSSGSGVTGTCSPDAAKETYFVDTYANVPKNSVDQLKAAIAQQPVSVTIEADTLPFQLYTSGILDSTACGTNLDHAVAAVGYGSESGQEYYIVRNSWGSSWGEEGYVRIAAVDGAGICGIQMDSLWPTAKN
jgi:hypothetical protein